MAFHSFRSSSDRSSSSLFRSRESSVGLSFNGLLVNSFLGLLAVFAADAVRRAGRALGDGAGWGPSIGASAVSSSPVPSNGVGGISSPPSLRTKASVSRSSSSSCSGVSPPWALKSSEAPLEVSSSSDAWAASPAASPPDVSSGESAAFLRVKDVLGSRKYNFLRPVFPDQPRRSARFHRKARELQAGPARLPPPGLRGRSPPPRCQPPGRGLCLLSCLRRDLPSPHRALPEKRPRVKIPQRLKL